MLPSIAHPMLYLHRSKDDILSISTYWTKYLPRNGGEGGAPWSQSQKSNSFDIVLAMIGDNDEQEDSINHHRQQQHKVKLKMSRIIKSWCCRVHLPRKPEVVASDPFETMHIATFAKCRGQWPSCRCLQIDNRYPSLRHQWGPWNVLNEISTLETRL